MLDFRAFSCYTVPMGKKDKERLNLYIDSDLKKQLEELAEQQRRSTNAQAVLFIEESIKRYQEQQK